MRPLLALLLLVAPAHAWEFTPGVPCLLAHETEEARVVLTYDPAQPFYSITITRSTPWPASPAFHMRFDGPRGRVIGTGAHSLSADGRALTVADRGFGNVLDGLQYNETAHASAGGVTETFALDGAAGPVADFRACAPLPPVS